MLYREWKAYDREAQYEGVWGRGYGVTKYGVRVKTQHLGTDMHKHDATAFGFYSDPILRNK